MDETFSHDMYSIAYPPGIERHFWNIARNDQIYRWLKPYLHEDDLIMDVGCGTGIVVQDLKSRGMNIRGVELGLAPIIKGMESDVQTGTDLFALDDSLKHIVKAVLLLDVLEHIEHRIQFLARIYREMPNCRLLVVTVPARREIWSQYDEHWGHHLRYDRPGLQSDLAESGFAAKKTSYFFHWTYLASLLMKLCGVERSTDFQPIKAAGPKAFCHRMLGLFTCWESRLVPGWVPGSSIISIASRKVDSSHSTQTT